MVKYVQCIPMFWVLVAATMPQCRSRFILLLQLMTTKELESVTRLTACVKHKPQGLGARKMNSETTPFGGYGKGSQYHWFLAGFICASLHQCVEAKNIDDVFQTSSRVFRLFSFFALHRFHYEVVVHPVMALGSHIPVIFSGASFGFPWCSLIHCLEASMNLGIRIVTRWMIKGNQWPWWVLLLSSRFLVFRVQWSGGLVGFYSQKIEDGHYWFCWEPPFFAT